MENMFDKLEEASVKLDEISKAKLGQYINKAATDSKEAALTGNDYVKKGQLNKASMYGKYVKKREKGISTAVKKLVKEDEEVELTMEESAAQLDEVSKTTLRNYTAKASETLKGRGRKSPKKIQRASNIELAKAKLSKILNKEYDKHEAEQNAKVEEVHSHFQKEAPKILATHGFTKIHSAKETSVYHKGHDNGHSTMVRIHHNPNHGEEASKYGSQSYGSKFSIHSTNGSGTLMGHNHTVHSGDVGEHKIKVVHGFHDAIIRATDAAKNERH